ncbi:MAG: bifunctional DNA-binding transcriptional regulator/O6-methylguanine-DNA methyltransferase Ada [Thermomonas sp.]|uniref:bifunctional DNA-binding transcriptional regulator/O6-methylguanine-DNA methyltransferase Ada n=1 Tax=Thermomonas sp. TaxID=1971895 RepID=UPI0039E6686C
MHAKSALAKSRRDAALVAAACRHIETAQQAPTLDALAHEAGLSPHHFHRLFKAVAGVTPKAYAQAHRGKALRDALSKRGAKVTDAAFDAGFNASSRFYDSAEAMLGMKPAQYRDGGADTRIAFAIGQCSLGAILVARSQCGVCAISLGDDADALLRELQDRFPRAELIGGDVAFERLVAQVVGLIEAPQLGLDLPLDIRGTAFQQRVWEALRAIPSGETASYAQIAQRIGSPKSVRAVAHACASNTLAVAIPCHRVVRSDGSVSGYRWGVERKRALLLRETRSLPSPRRRRGEGAEGG